MCMDFFLDVVMIALVKVERSLDITARLRFE